MEGRTGSTSILYTGALLVEVYRLTKQTNQNEYNSYNIVYSRVFDFKKITFGYSYSCTDLEYNVLKKSLSKFSADIRKCFIINGIWLNELHKFCKV